MPSTTRPTSFDPYKTLGIESSASPAEIKAAYRSRIRGAHPDVTGGSDEVAVLLNEAYSILSDPDRRVAYDDGTTATVHDNAMTCPECNTRVPVHLVNAHWRAHLISQNGPLCAACDRYPTHPLRLRSHAGFLLWRTTSELEENFCRSCGTGIFREVQARNITRGPWGIVSFFTTFLALFGNLGRFTAFKSGLDSPTPAHPDSESVLEGRGVLRRPGVLLVISIVVAAVVLVIANSSQPGYAGSPSPTYTPPPVTRSVSFDAGTCVEIEDDWVSELPSCTGADGVVKAVVWNPSSCPVATDTYIERDNGSYACLLEY